MASRKQASFLFCFHLHLMIWGYGSAFLVFSCEGTVFCSFLVLLFVSTTSNRGSCVGRGLWYMFFWFGHRRGECRDQAVAFSVAAVLG